MPTIRVIVRDGTGYNTADDYNVENVPSIGEGITTGGSKHEVLHKVVAVVCRLEDQFHLVVVEKIADVTNDSPEQIAEKMCTHQ